MSASSRTKMPSDQVVAIDFTDLLGQELPARVVSRDVYMCRAWSDIPK
ncbi:MAG: hypothetical protein WA376_08320 [Terrimicrobiaceae bacterium]